MANIVAKTTIVADTGTGHTYKPYRTEGDTVEYREDGATAQPAFLRFTRVEPKATKTYAGTGRAESRLTRQYADAEGRLWTANVVVSVALPDFLSDSDKAAFVTEGLLLSRDAASVDALTKRLILPSDAT
jgi:hypothetical protein